MTTLQHMQSRNAYWAMLVKVRDRLLFGVAVAVAVAVA
jgi:hypothetical protein